MRASRVLRPSGVQRVRREDGTQVSESRNEGGCSGNADFTVTGLEDLIRPRHADRDGGAQAEANLQTISGGAIARRSIV